MGGMADMLNNPEMMGAMSGMMANLTPEDMQAMASMAGGMGGGAPGGQSPRCRFLPHAMGCCASRLLSHPFLSCRWIRHP